MELGICIKRDPESEKPFVFVLFKTGNRENDLKHRKEMFNITSLHYSGMFLGHYLHLSTSSMFTQKVKV